MNLKLQKRLAAKVANVGLNRVSIQPASVSAVKEAITKADIKALIRDGAIRVFPEKRPSGLRTRERRSQQKKGKQRGHGTRRGSAKARLGDIWPQRIRAMRKLLQDIKAKGQITNDVYRDIYAKAKGGFFRDRGHILFYLKQKKLTAETRAGEKSAVKGG
ncbi:MAG: 50S ribosomal protein L19e [DPANN group archaeon]|nr:50S ribosomal protein L19e [DPANN group archaeon]